MKKNDKINTLLLFFALSRDDKLKYLPCKMNETQLHLPHSDIITDKPLLFLAQLLVDHISWSTPNPPEREEDMVLAEVRSVLVFMLDYQLDYFWYLEMFEEWKQNYTGQIWEAVQTLAKNALKKLGIDPGFPKTPFEYFFNEYSYGAPLG